MGRWRMAAAAALSALAALGSAGCAQHSPGPGYYWQSVTGHLRLMQAARPIDDWLSDAHAPDTLKQRLALARRMRAFAVDELALPDNASYHRYADLGRRAAVYNVVAAPPLSLTLNTWCFPVAGCVGYRGYFDEADARTFADTLRPDWEVAVYPVPAYSTLGWTNWLGGDPLLNTFIAYPEGELARIVFHELAHQAVYAADDTAFNESFATAVERIGGERWLQRMGTPEARSEYERFDARRRQFRALTLSVRQRLLAIYADAASDPRDRLARKAEAMHDFRRDYAQLKAQWGGYAGYDAWVAQANNASFGAQAAYDDWVPAFMALYQQQGQDLRRFYQAVRPLAKQAKETRQAALRDLMPPTTQTAQQAPHTPLH